MTQEEKQLLLKDLCARLPYGIECHYNCPEIDDDEKEGDATIIHIDKRWMLVELDICEMDIECIKPYLRPMSSMTEEEKAEYYETHELILGVHMIKTLKSYDWLNKNHFDCRGLIPIGLALEAPEDMYKTE